jgi:hypothetical protein
VLSTERACELARSTVTAAQVETYLEPGRKIKGCQLG